MRTQKEIFNEIAISIIDILPKGEVFSEAVLEIKRLPGNVGFTGYYLTPKNEKKWLNIFEFKLDSSCIEDLYQITQTQPPIHQNWNRAKYTLYTQGSKARIELTQQKNAAGVYEAKVYAKGDDGIEIIKTGNGGRSTFFPDDWDEARILDEVEHAVSNNKGFANGIDAANGYYGFSKNGNVKIQFYYRESDGYIGSFFPTRN